MAIGVFFWWAWFQLQRSIRSPWGFQPVRAAVLVWLLAMVVVYANAMSLPMPGDEISPGDSGLLKLLGLTGILLIANDGTLALGRCGP